MTLLLLLHAAVAVAIPPLARRLGARAYLVAAAAPLAVLGWLVAHATTFAGGGAVEEDLEWVGALDLGIALRVDAFSALMALLVAGIGVLVFVYARAYFDDAAGSGRTAAALVGFAGAMLGLVTADHLLLLYVFWELTSVTSYVLIAGDGRQAAAREAAQQALFITVCGGLAMLAGFVLLGQAAGTYRLSALSVSATPAATAGALLVLAGAFTKSAQVPFHGWLPGAMAAPTPISAYLHSATMVKAGVYLVARLAPVLAGVVAVWVPLTVGVGLVTMVLAAAWALRQDDLKLLLAYGTVSQLGLMMALVGTDVPELTYAGIAVLLAHALYKGALFLVVGNVDHATGTRNLRRLRGLSRAMPLTAVAAVVTGASMMGIPPLFGFVAKEAGLDEFLHIEAAWSGVAAAAVVAGTVLTVAYALRFLVGGFTDSAEASIPGPAGEPAAADHEMGPTWLVPIGVLAVLTIAFGVWLAPVNRALGAATEALGTASEAKLALWHGITPALLLSAAAILAGVGIHVAYRGGMRVWDGLPSLPRALDAFRASVATILRTAGRVTGVVQNGSLPVYLAIIAVTAFALPASGLLAGPVLDRGITGIAPPLQIVVALLVVAGGLGVAITHRRFVVLLFLGAVGYGMAVLFWMQGAPDLALTQVTIETVTLLLFVLVLRRLPEHFTPPRWAFGRRARFAISAFVGVFVAVVTVLAVSVDHPPAISEEYLRRALPEADGHNVVNVILVDFRGMDTIGEITVLVIAAIGIAELVKRFSPDFDVPDFRPLFPPERASLVTVTTIRAVYPLAILVSLFFLVRGHNHPGGGFIGGLVGGAALVLRYVAHGPGVVDDAIPVRASRMLAVGMLLAVGTASAGWAFGDTFFEAAVLERQIPLFGTVKASSTLVFDTGVYLIVVGFVSNALQTFGSEESRP